MISGDGRVAAACRWVAVSVLAAAIVVSVVGLWITWPKDTAPSAAPVLREKTTQQQLPEVDSRSLAPAAKKLDAESFDTAWEDRVAASTGMSPVAARAYGTAVLRLAKEQPTCRIGWTTIAGIGAVESAHGTEAGSSLRADGRTRRLIIGPALDGTAGNAAIASDAAFEKFHGDPTWDHAVGPMQFISSTWARWASDGNDDGSEDPSNIYDAAYATGRYLCASGLDLTVGSNWGEAIFSYNHSADYVASVYYRVQQYAAVD